MTVTDETLTRANKKLEAALDVATTEPILPALRYPVLFRGFFARAEDGYGPFLEEARRELARMPVPADLGPFYREWVTDNPQPSFMLLPIIYLRLAEAGGGVTQAHRRYLPALMLAMEVTAIADDTIDRTPMRSGRASFPQRFGEGSVVPFVGALCSLTLELARRCDARAVELTSDYLVRLFSLELWERRHVYPPPASWESLLQCRYTQTVVGSRVAFDTALALHDRAPLSDDFLAPFSRIFQDVDDLVNLVEERENEGENDDLRMGVVTRPLCLALARRPELGDELGHFWKPYRALAGASLHELVQRRRVVDRKSRARFEAIRAEIRANGIPGTVAQISRDRRAAVAAAPIALRPAIEEFIEAIVDRLNHCPNARLSELLSQADPVD